MQVSDFGIEKMELNHTGSCAMIDSPYILLQLKNGKSYEHGFSICYSHTFSDGIKLSYILQIDVVQKLCP